LIWTVLYFVAVIFFAYRIGSNNGLAGVAFFLVAFVLHQMFVFGPESLLSGDCYTDWDGRGNPSYCS
jgi:hypothetical protein